MFSLWTAYSVMDTLQGKEHPFAWTYVPVKRARDSVAVFDADIPIPVPLTTQHKDEGNHRLPVVGTAESIYDAIFGEGEKDACEPREEFTCMISGCISTFNSHRAYESHYASAHVNVCRYCHFVLASAHLLDLHLLERHDSLFHVMSKKRDMYRCLVEGCPSVFKHNKARKEHLVEVHCYPKDFKFNPTRRKPQPSQHAPASTATDAPRTQSTMKDATVVRDVSTGNVNSSQQGLPASNTSVSVFERASVGSNPPGGKKKPSAKRHTKNNTGSTVCSGPALSATSQPDNCVSLQPAGDVDMDGTAAGDAATAGGVGVKPNRALRRAASRASRPPTDGSPSSSIVGMPLGEISGNATSVVQSHADAMTCDVAHSPSVQLVPHRTDVGDIGGNSDAPMDVDMLTEAMSKATIHVPRSVSFGRKRGSGLYRPPRSQAKHVTAAPGATASGDAME